MTLTSQVAADLMSRFSTDKPGEICPDAPAELSSAVTELGGNVLYIVLAMFAIAIAISIGLILGGKAANSPMLTKAGAGGLVVVVLAAVAWVTVPGLQDGIIGTGCI